MQLRIVTKAPKHHVYCSGYGKWAAKGCHECQTIRQREAARRARGPDAAADLCGER